MLAGPPPTFNTDSLPLTMKQQSQSSLQNFPGQFQPPILPPNFQGNPQSQSQSHSQFPIQPPILPPNFSGNQSLQPQLTSMQPPTHSSTNPSSISGHQPQVNSQLSKYPPPISGQQQQQQQQQQFNSYPPTKSNGISQSPVQHPYLNSGPPPPSSAQTQHPYLNSGPPPSSAQTQPPSNTSNQFGAPPTTASFQFQNSQPPFSNQQSSNLSSNQFSTPPKITNSQFSNSQPLLSNQPPSNIGGAPPFTQSQYPGSQSTYNGSLSSFQTNSPSTSSTNYPPQSQHPNSYGPSSMSGSQLNAPNSNRSQSPVPGLLQRPFAQSRVDPDLIPDVVRTFEQNRERYKEPFITNTPGLLPPPVTLDFVCQDQGSCNPRFMRSSIYTIPYTNDMVKKANIPITLSITPLADLRSDELEPPLADFGEIGPVRCQRCKAYMCTYMQFIDGGKRFNCCFCEAATDVPAEYFNHLDHSGRRMDWYQRPELCLGSYEALATKQYCKNEQWPKSPAFIFMIDVSYSSVRSGLVSYICHILKTDLLDYLPKDKNAEVSTVRVGFATFDKHIHFYNIKNTLGQPQMMVVSDLEDIFVPLLDGFLCSPQDTRSVIDSLLDQIPQTFANTQETETILAPVIQSGIEALKEANCPGKIYIFSTTLPIAVAPGKLSNRDDKKILGTEKEKTILSPVTNNIYTKLGEECAQNGCAVDLFVFPNTYMDLATIGEVCRLSGGQIYKFKYFSVENDGELLLDELKRNFQRTTVFDALMRVRTSTGIRAIDFFGNFYMTNATEMILGTIDSDKSVCVEIKHDDKLPIDNNAYVQVALLYTSISGQRRLRILTLALAVTSSYNSLFSSIDLGTILNYTTKLAVRSISTSTPKQIRDSIISQVANALACYRLNCATGSVAGQLVLPDTLKLFPVYACSLVKSDVLIGTQTVTTDDRSWLIQRIMSMNIKGIYVYLYPRIYPLHNLEEDKIPPSMIRCLYDRLSDRGAYILENGLVMYIWLGSQVDPQFVQSLFGIQSTPYIQLETCRIVELDNTISKNVRTLLNMIRNERNCHMKVFFIKQRDSIEPYFKNYLVEDKGITGGASYVDFLFHIHHEIRQSLQ